MINHPSPSPPPPPPSPPLISRLAEREDKYDGLAATLQLKEELLTSLTSEKSKSNKEAQSKAAYHNQSLAQAKQQCAQLTEQVEAHKRREWELSRKIEDLQLASAESGTPRSMVVGSRGAGGRGEGPSPCTPLRGVRSETSVLTPPTRPLIPGKSEEGELRAENKKLKQDLSCLQMNFQLITQKSTQLRSQVKELETNMAELQNLFDRSQAEKEELQGRFDETENGLRGRIGKQAKEVERAKELSEEVEKLQGELERLQGENRELRGELESKGDQALDGKDLISKLDSVKQSLTEEKLAMGEEMATLQAELEALQGKCQDLEDSTSVYREDKKKRSGTINALKAKVSKLTKEKAELAEQLTVASERLDQACDKAQLHREEIRALEVDLMAKDGEIAALSVQRRNHSHLPVEVKELRAKVVETAEELADLRSKNDELVKARERLEGKVSVLDKTNTKLQRESKHGSEMARKMTLELERLEEMADSLRASLESKGRECMEAQLKLKDSEAKLARLAGTGAERDGEVASLVGKLRDLEAHNLELADKIACRQREETAEWRSDLQQKVLDLEGKLDAAEFAVLEKDSRISDLKCAYELMEAENSTLLSQVTSLSEMVSTRNFKLEAHQMQSVRQESDVLEIMERITSLEAEHGGCAGVITKLRDCNEALKESLESADSLKRELEGKVSHLEMDLRDLEKSSAVLKTENSVLQDEVVLRVTRNEEAAQEHEDAMSRVRQLEQDLRTETIALSAAREDLTHAQRVHCDSEREGHVEVESLRSRVSGLELKIEGFQREKVELKSRVMGLRVELREKDLLYSSLKIQRDSLSEQYESLKMTALSVLQSDPDQPDANEEENHIPAHKVKGAGLGGKAKGPKSILKKPQLRKVLRPVQDTS